MPSKTQASFTFVNVMNLEDISSTKTQTVVRSHVARKGNQLRCVNHTTGGEDETKKSAAHDTELTTGTSLYVARIDSKESHGFGFVDQSFLGGERWVSGSPLIAGSSPFDRALFLSVPAANQMPLWFTIALWDETAYRISLARLAMAVDPYTGKKVQTNLSIEYYTMAIQQINRRLKDPLEDTSEGLLGAVIGFVCYDHQIWESSRSGVHLRGIESIVARRGGLHSHNTSSVIRLMLFWNDTRNALGEDSQPRFTVPIDITRDLDNAHNFPKLHEYLSRLTTNIPSLTDIALVLYRTARLARVINEASCYPGFWRDTTFTAERFLPVLHAALSLPRLRTDSCPIDEVDAVREILRLACLTILALLCIHWNLSPLENVLLYSQRLAVLMHEQTHMSHPELMLWASVIAACPSLDQRPNADYGAIWTGMKILRFDTWKVAQQMMESILWIDPVMRDPIDQLGRMIDTG